MDFTTANQLLTVVNVLIEQEKFDVLEVLQSIPEWNELITESTEVQFTISPFRIFKYN